MNFKKLQQYSFLFLLMVVSIAFLWVVHNYIMPIFWAIVLGIIFYPTQRRLLKKIKSPSLTSVVTIFIILVVFFVPLFTVGSLVVKESVTIYQQISTSNENGNGAVDLFGGLADNLTFLKQLGIDEAEAKEKIAGAAGSATKWLSGQALSFGGKTFAITLQFFLMLYVLFFFLRDGDKIKKRLMEILPLGNKREERLFSKFTSITRAVVKGTLIVGFVQGAVGGILFYIAGVQGAVLWGALMMVLSIIPAVGTIIVWLPVGLILLFIGSIWQGVLVLAGGVFIVGMLDNILRPILVGKDTKMPDVFILISTLGGLSILGITGFVIGPIVAGFFLVMWDMFEEEYHTELLRWG